MDRPNNGGRYCNPQSEGAKAEAAAEQSSRMSILFVTSSPLFTTVNTYATRYTIFTNLCVLKRQARHRLVVTSVVSNGISL